MSNTTTLGIGDVYRLNAVVGKDSTSSGKHWMLGKEFSRDFLVLAVRKEAEQAMSAEVTHLQPLDSELDAMITKLGLRGLPEPVTFRDQLSYSVRFLGKMVQLAMMA